MPSGLAAAVTAPGSYGFIALFALSGALELGLWTESDDKEPGNFGDPVGFNQYTQEMRETGLHFLLLLFKELQLVARIIHLAARNWPVFCLTNIWQPWLANDLPEAVLRVSLVYLSIWLITKERELNNGRFAMFAALGIISAELYTGKDAIEQFGL